MNNSKKNRDFIEEVREENPILDVVVEYGVNLKQEGSNYKGHCPFHDDTEPSFTVYPDTESYYCFGSLDC